MSNRLFCCLAQLPLPSKRQTLVLWMVVVSAMACVPCAWAGGDAPAWMHTLASAPLPPHDEKTDAILLYSDKTVNVISADKIKYQIREAYKILRPDGRRYGTVEIPFDPNRKISNLHAWCIPAQGKDFEAKEKEAAEVSVPRVEGSELITDVKYKLLRIPAAEPGNVVGYEYEIEVRPLVLQDVWQIQEESPSQQRHYSLHLPPGWEYTASWINHAEVKPKQSGDNQWEWTVQDVKGVRAELDMPPLHGLVGQMIVSFSSPAGRIAGGFSNWKQMGDWYLSLTNGRRNAPPEIKQKVAALTATIPAPLDKMKAIADFMQREVRYVAISLGIGGIQPHTAAEVFNHRYGDCKDKATLMSSMLQEIGVESYYVIINSERGSVSRDTPAHVSGFDHAILAIRLPDGVASPSLVATIQHPRLGRILFFDPTNTFTPFGQIGGYLQSNWGLLVGPDGGELVLLPQLSSEGNGIQRTAKFTLSPSGTLSGEVTELRLGDRAVAHRATLRSAAQDADKIKPIESMLAGSLSSFKIVKATVANLKQTDLPFEYQYWLTADGYAKPAGDLLTLRPRIFGSKSSGLLETKEHRIFPVEFSGPSKDTDTFEIALPKGYEVDELPPAVDADFSFASYHSKSEVLGNLIRYTRTFEIKELSVPASRSDELKKFYRIIANDERNTAVLKTASR
jgi:transglutaminase-like putative cysteine protease